MHSAAVFRFLAIQALWVEKPIQVKGFPTVQHPLCKLHYDQKADKNWCCEQILVCYTRFPARYEEGAKRKKSAKPAISRSTDRETASCHFNSYPVRPASYHNRTSLERGSNDHQAQPQQPQ